MAQIPAGPSSAGSASSSGFAAAPAAAVVGSRGPRALLAELHRLIPLLDAECGGNPVCGGVIGALEDLREEVKPRQPSFDSLWPTNVRFMDGGHTMEPLWA